MGKRQPSLNLYGKGIHKTAAGHLRYHSPSSLRDKYVHRELAERLIEETPYSLRLYVPWPYEVHHLDYNKEHNCPANFLFLSEALHSRLTVDRPRDDGGRFGRKWIPRWKPAPQHVLDFMEQMEDEVPF